ncbi:MAG: hypothetical protein GC162_17055 [Planctomycetes bacterium]|nr:hypothetical protein [Planctomycetota bacterium]
MGQKKPHEGGVSAVFMAGLTLAGIFIQLILTCEFDALKKRRRTGGPRRLYKISRQAGGFCHASQKNFAKSDDRSPRKKIVRTLGTSL